jgi:NitT/TauT family transport system permease protein/taurine transport system permease protein
MAAISLLSDGALLKHTWDSTFRLLVGFIVGVSVAIPLGIAMGLNRHIARFFDPLINLAQAIPGLAWIPLALVWFGTGFTSLTFIIFMAVFFPVVFSTLGGVRGTNETLVWAVLTMGGNKIDVLKDVVLPGALPSIVTGIRIGMGYGWRSVIAAEMIAASSGLGYMIFDARNWLDTPVVIVGMIVMGLCWLALDRLFLKPIEASTIEKWGLVSKF